MFLLLVYGIVGIGLGKKLLALIRRVARMEDSDNTYYCPFALDKEYYPFKVKIEGPCLTEEDATKDYQRSYCNDYLSNLHFCIGNLKYSINISNESITEQLYGKAFFDTSNGNDGSFSIFGTDRVITNISLRIYPSDTKHWHANSNEGFDIYVSPKELYDGEIEEELLEIRFFVSRKKFQSIKNIPSDKNSQGESTKNIRFSVNTKLVDCGHKLQPKINGLYQLPSYESENHFKVLLDARQIANKDELNPDLIFDNSGTFMNFHLTLL